MKMHAILLVLIAQFILVIGMAHPCSVSRASQRKIIKSSEVIATAVVLAVKGKVGSRVAHLKILEVLKGKTDKSFVDASFSENNLCGEDVIYDPGGKYILYFIKNPTWEGLASPAQLKASNKGTIENIKRFIRIAKTEDKRNWRTLYLEIFQSGENQFFLEAYEELESTDTHHYLSTDSHCSDGNNPWMSS